MEQVAWKSKINRSEFTCMCMACDETMEKTDDKRVLIITCGCMFKKKCLEATHLRYSFANKIIQFLDTSIDEIGQYECPNPTHTVSRTFTIRDIVNNNQYVEIFNKKEEGETLQEISGYPRRDFAFVPKELAQVYVAITAEQKEKNWKDKTWYEFKAGLQKWDKALKQKTEADWKKRLHQALGIGGSPIYKEIKWSMYESFIFTFGALYHGSLAIISNLGLKFLNHCNFISNDTFKDLQTHEVGNRLAELFLQYYGMHYNRSRPETWENKVWSWVKGENRQLIEW